MSQFNLILVFIILIATIENGKCIDKRITTPSCKVIEFVSDIKAYKSFQAECHRIPRFDELQSMKPAQLTHLLIRCNSSQTSNNHQKNQNDENYKAIEIIEYFPSLVFFYISSCMEVKNIYNTLFHNGNKLVNVHFDNLPITYLPPNLFPNSPYLIELTLSNLTQLKSIHSFLFAPRANPNITKINFYQLNLNADDIQTFLFVNHRALKSISITNSIKTKLSFDKSYFQYFNLESLLIIHNQIDPDLEFLTKTNSTEISLANNRLTTNKVSMYYFSNPFQNKLTLSNNNLYGIFPDTTTKYSRSFSRSNLKILLLNRNEITGLDDFFGDIFQNLNFLDLRHNRIKRLPSSLGQISWGSNTGALLLKGGLNSLFCGCELNWMFGDKLDQRKNQSLISQVFRDSDLYCDSYIRDNRETNRYEVVSKPLVKVATQGSTKCLAPRVFVQIVKNGRVIGEIDKNGTRLNLYECEYIKLRCVAQADPIPQVGLTTNVPSIQFLQQSGRQHSNKRWWWWTNKINNNADVSPTISLPQQLITRHTKLHTITQQQINTQSIVQCQASNQFTSTGLFTILLTRRNNSRLSSDPDNRFIYRTYRCNSDKFYYSMQLILFGLLITFIYS